VKEGEKEAPKGIIMPDNKNTGGHLKKSRGDPVECQWGEQRRKKRISAKERFRGAKGGEKV